MSGFYSDQEMMTLAAGREAARAGAQLLFAGTGLSMLAAAAARQIYLPEAVVFFETGAVDPDLGEIPLSVADSRVMQGGCLNAGLNEAFALLSHRRLRSIAFLGAAQIDPHGNLNSTCLGGYPRPQVRLPGCGGACDAASLAEGFIVFMQQEKRRFVEKVDYISSVGWLAGGDSRRRAGLERGGPLAVVTNLGVLRFGQDDKRLYLAEYYPGVEPEQIARQTGFALDVSQAVEAQPPSAQELAVLRQRVDPQRLILGPQAA